MTQANRLAQTGRKRRLSLTPYLMVLPSFSIYFVFVLIPILMTFELSFTNYDFYKTKDYVGLANYTRMFADPVFLIALRNTIVYAVCTIVPELVIGLLLAVFLNMKLIGRKFFRISFYMPHVISMVSISMIFLWIYDTSDGLLNMLMKSLGLPAQKWLFDLNLALLCLIIIGIWKMVGFIMIIYLAGIQQIPSHLYEAATIDGATGVHKFFNITVPLLRPTTFFLFVTSCVSSFMVFEQVNVMTQGGPLNATTTVIHQIFQRAFVQYQMGYASAMAVFMFFIVLIVTLLNFYFGKQGQNVDMG
ncbi:carbohydrate ABC transporter permease [Paenibacillus piri]|nr:sugar ABC transporter permease [Paenibacillus piri]